MSTSDAQQRFEESKRLYAAGRFGEALMLLAQLDAEHPNDRHLLYPLALCLARVGRVDEARNICDRLIREFNDPKAAALRQQLGEPAPPPMGLGIPGLQPIDLGDLNAPIVKYTPPPPEPAWKSWLLYGGAVVGTIAVILLVTYVVLLVGEQAKQSAENNVPMAERLQNLQNPEQVGGAYWAVLLLGFVLSPALLYGLLALFGKLPYEEAWRSAGHITLLLVGLAVFQYLAGRYLTCCGGLLSLIITIVFVKRTYMLETGETILWVVCLIMLNIAMGALQVLVLLS